jgi:hypothetical protein
MTKAMDSKTGETIITAEVEVAISLEVVDTSKEVAIPTITTKTAAVDGEIEVDTTMVAAEEEDTKDKAHTPTTVVLISDLEPKGHPEVKHQALDPLNRKASLVDQDVLYT